MSRPLRSAETHYQMSGLSRGAIWGAGIGVALDLLVVTESLGDFAMPLLVVMLVAMVIGSLILRIAPWSSSSMIPAPAPPVAPGSEIFGYIAIVAICMVVGSLVESVTKGAGWKDIPLYMRIFLLSSLALTIGLLLFF
jgi:Na+/glutamate symporter